ncbi:MAG: FAD-dependent oxidoreductase [Pseudomonadota bacterium]
MTLPSQAQVVIIGGGIVGCSSLYHLAKMGCQDAILLERDRLTSGTTWHAAGIVGSLRGSAFYTHVTAYATKLYQSLEAESGQATGYKTTGGLSLATTPASMEELKRMHSVGKALGNESHVIGPQEIESFAPLLRVDDLEGGLWIPGDGQTNPTDTTMALAKAARQLGGRIFEGQAVRRIVTKDGAVCGVETDHETIACEKVILCGGIWSRQLARSVGVTVPVQAAEHMYIVTEPMENVPLDQPFIRDFGAQIYAKGDAGKLVMGGFEPVSRPWQVGGVPDDASFTMLPEDWDHFSFFMEGALHRIPSLGQAGIRTFMNGPEGFTPDNVPVLGEAPGLKNFFVAAGFNSSGIAGSGGAGKTIAEWVLTGETEWDPWEADVRRFEAWHGSDAFMAERATEFVGTVFATHWPYKQLKTCRNLRHSPLKARYWENRPEIGQACFGAAAGWERPLWFAPEGAEPEQAYSFGDQDWWPHAAREVKATREAVALYDLSPFGKIWLQGADALPLLQRLCANNVDVAPGRVVYTQMLNPRGGIEADVTISRPREDGFWMTTGAGLRVHNMDWIKRHQRPDEHVTVIDMTSTYAVLGVMGPQSRSLLSRVSSCDLSNEAFPFATAQEIDLGPVPARAQRVSFVGELGWEIFVPSEFAIKVFDVIQEAGLDLGLAHAGFHALDCCRIEKNFKHWGHDLSGHVTPLEAGLGFALDLDKAGGFMGRDALLRQKEQGLKRLLALFEIMEERPLPLHDEPIYRDSVLVGATTSGGYGPTFDRCFAMGLVTHPEGITKDFLQTGRWEIEIAARRYPLRPHLRAPYDPTGARMKM